MQLFIATYSNGTNWIDLHDDPMPFPQAQDRAITAMLAGRGPTRLRIGTPER